MHIPRNGVPHESDMRSPCINHEGTLLNLILFLSFLLEGATNNSFSGEILANPNECFMGLNARGIVMDNE